jgi:hypothetical protein
MAKRWGRNLAKQPFTCKRCKQRKADKPGHEDWVVFDNSVSPPVKWCMACADDIGAFDVRNSEARPEGPASSVSEALASDTSMGVMAQDVSISDAESLARIAKSLEQLAREFHAFVDARCGEPPAVVPFKARN